MSKLLGFNNKNEKLFSLTFFNEIIQLAEEVVLQKSAKKGYKKHKFRVFKFLLS